MCPTVRHRCIFFLYAKPPKRGGGGGGGGSGKEKLPPVRPHDDNAPHSPPAAPRTRKTVKTHRTAHDLHDPVQAAAAAGVALQGPPRPRRTAKGEWARPGRAPSASRRPELLGRGGGGEGGPTQSTPSAHAFRWPTGHGPSHMERTLKRLPVTSSHRPPLEGGLAGKHGKWGGGGHRSANQTSAECCLGFTARGRLSDVSCVSHRLNMRTTQDTGHLGQNRKVFGRQPDGHRPASRGGITAMY